MRKEKDSIKVSKPAEIRKYGQAKLKHSRKGVNSCLVAASVLATIIILILIAYVTKGKGNGLLGSAGIIAMWLACYGIVIGYRGFKEREKRYITCKLGMGFNILFLLGFLLLFLRGLF